LKPNAARSFVNVPHRWLSAAGAVILAAASIGTISAAGRSNLLFIENNNPAPGMNAVLGYSRNADGSLTDLPGSPFYTNGTGYRNTNEIIGPDDTDGELLLSPDKRFLFAVNEGSNDISVFEVRLDGTLRLVPGSPFASGGIFPCSLTWQNGFLYVANRGNGILPTMVTPTYTAGTRGATNFSVLQINGDGSLALLSQLSVDAPDGSSPAQVVSSPDGQFVFGLVPFSPTNDAFVVPIFPQSQSRLLAFAVDEDSGGLNAQPEVALPKNPLFVIGGVDRSGFMLGIRPHPMQNILYANAVLANTLSVWTWGPTGALTFGEGVNPGTIGGAADPCWLGIDPAGRWIFAAAVHGDQVASYSLANPTAPTLTQNVTLGGPSGPLPAGTPEPYGNTTAPFNLATDPTGNFLYVINHATCVSVTIDATNCPQGNAIHVLQVNQTTGALTEEPYSPIIPSPILMPTNARPKGLVIL